ncbi:ATP-dependent RNA helicase DBP5, putative [Plasmodium ovale]|uniref:RNA helicase n=1 Tax=Plasmodium ovale TaxID=36330 RepID=A0A1D3TL58_PLAOA|nr:ATP-dependent RNA helicase DBP5, putative [Plasmodium ovale]
MSTKGESASGDIKNEGTNDDKSNKEEKLKENSDLKEGEKGDDNVMNMLLTYLQKNKNDPKLLQTMLSVMNGQTEGPSSVSQSNEPDGSDRPDTTGNGQKEHLNGQAKEDVKKECNQHSDMFVTKGGNNVDEKEKQQSSVGMGLGEGEKSEKTKEMEKGSKIMNMFSRKEDKEDVDDNNAEKEKNKIVGEPDEGKKNTGMGKFGVVNFSAIIEATRSAAKEAAKETAKETAKDGEQEGPNRDANEGEEKGLVKKKHMELVEDNDDYEIEEGDPKEPFEEEAISLIENMNLVKEQRGGEPAIISGTGIGSGMDIGNGEGSKFGFSKFSGSTALRSGEGKEQGDFRLYHAKNTWEELKIDNELIQILTYQKFLGPSKIQAYALPIIINSNNNLIAQSQNGSGKTLTFVIAMLTKINRTLKCLQALCICPTRELSQQNYEVIGNFTKYLNVKVFLAVPLCEKYNKSDGYQLYVGTPGKTLDFMKRKYIDTSNVRLFILDEADDLIDIKNNMSSQVETIKRFLPKYCQILLFSATYNKEVRIFADQFAPKATKISVRQEDLTLKCVKQYYLITENEEQKYYYLSELYCSMTISQCVIFVNSKKGAFNLYEFMTENNHNVTLICADSVISRFTKNKIQKANIIGMDPKTRDSLMADFKKGISKVLICTDLLARGIDVPSISLVINFDLPYIYQGRIGENANLPSNQRVNMETYIHRIGRTGRFGTKGMAINFVSKNQMPHIHQIEQFYKCTIADLEFDSELMITSLTKLKG